MWARVGMTEIYSCVHEFKMNTKMDGVWAKVLEVGGCKLGKGPPTLMTQIAMWPVYSKNECFLIKLANLNPYGHLNAF